VLQELFRIENSPLPLRPLQAASEFLGGLFWQSGLRIAKLLAAEILNTIQIPRGVLSHAQ
jgi:hypothetical protein